MILPPFFGVVQRITARRSPEVAVTVGALGTPPGTTILLHPEGGPSPASFNARTRNE